MPTVDGSSALAEVKAAVDDNASFEEDQSLAKCRAYITAVRVLIRRLSESASMSDSGGSLSRRIESLEKDLQAARDWLASHGGLSTIQGPSVTEANFEDFRN